MEPKGKLQVKISQKVGGHAIFKCHFSELGHFLVSKNHKDYVQVMLLRGEIFT